MPFILQDRRKYAIEITCTIIGALCLRYCSYVSTGGRYIPISVLSAVVLQF